MEFSIPNFGGVRPLSGVTVTNTAQRVSFPGGSSSGSREWSGLLVTNCSPAAPVYLMVKSFAPVPTAPSPFGVSSFHYKLTAGSHLVLPFNQQVEVWAVCDGLDTAPLTVVELL